MTRALVVTLLALPLGAVAACQSSPLTASPPGQTPASPQLAASLVADPCAANSSEAACKAAGAACSWSAVACPDNTACPAAVCATTDPCATYTDSRACSGDTRCAWTASHGTDTMPALCPVGHDCTSSGFCLTRGVTGNGCGCLQPVACPASGSCPAVSCSCPPPSFPTVGGGSSTGGGTCSCSCPACLPGEACPPCKCDCGTGGSGDVVGTGGADGGATGAGGSTGGSTGNCGSGGGTCTCNCPECPAGQACPACSCACGAVTTMTTTMPAGSTVGGGAADAVGGSSGTASTPRVCVCPACPEGAACAPCDCATPPADPCTAHTDAASCTADSAGACTWVQLGIACFTTPCPSGSCMRMSPPPDAGGGTGSSGGGCACACPACAANTTCPPCTCNCCSGSASGSSSAAGSGTAPGGSVSGPQSPTPVAARKTWH